MTKAWRGWHQENAKRINNGIIGGEMKWRNDQLNMKMAKINMAWLAKAHLAATSGESGGGNESEMVAKPAAASMKAKMAKISVGIAPHRHRGIAKERRNIIWRKAGSYRLAAALGSAASSKWLAESWRKIISMKSMWQNRKRKRRKRGENVESDNRRQRQRGISVAAKICSRQAAKINETAAAKKWRKRHRAGEEENGWRKHQWRRKWKLSKSVKCEKRRKWRQSRQRAMAKISSGGGNECESGEIGGGINNNQQRRKWKQRQAGEYVSKAAYRRRRRVMAYQPKIWRNAS
jgi:hypothetical protein